MIPEEGGVATVAGVELDPTSIDIHKAGARPRLEAQGLEDLGEVRETLVCLGEGVPGRQWPGQEL